LASLIRFSFKLRDPVTSLNYAKEFGKKTLEYIIALVVKMGKRCIWGANCKTFEMDNGQLTMDNAGCGLRRDITSFAAHMDILPHWFRSSFMWFCSWLKGEIF
jgi:hypothetical protein